MEIYKFINLDNGNILLEKIIIDDKNYMIINKNNGDKILQKVNNINITEIKNYDFKKSIIIDCIINDISCNILKYRPILIYIYDIINNGTEIIKNTKLNIKTIKKKDEGYYYLENIGISIQGVDSNKCLLEIINQCIKNEINIKLKIKLINENIIYISL